jgi:hypothetical protein
MFMKIVAAKEMEMAIARVMLPISRPESLFFLDATRIKPRKVTINGADMT